MRGRSHECVRCFCTVIGCRWTENQRARARDLVTSHLRFIDVKLRDFETKIPPSGVILTFGHQAAREARKVKRTEISGFLLHPVGTFKYSSSGQSRVGVATSQVTSREWSIRNGHASPQSRNLESADQSRAGSMRP